jgi:hypothetical protein
MPLKINYTNNVPGRGTGRATYQDRAIAGLVMCGIAALPLRISRGNGHGYVHDLWE